MSRGALVRRSRGYWWLRGQVWGGRGQLHGPALRAPEGASGVNLLVVSDDSEGVLVSERLSALAEPLAGM